MKIAYRLSGMGWVPKNQCTLDELFDLKKWAFALFVARNQQEYDTLRGYELVYGVKLPLVLESKPADFWTDGSHFQVFLWVDFPNNPD
ncbi:hypothetical protein D3C76_28050 [compost metagenome]